MAALNGSREDKSPLNESSLSGCFPCGNEVFMQRPLSRRVVGLESRQTVKPVSSVRSFMSLPISRFALAVGLALVSVAATRADTLVLVAGGDKDGDNLPATQAALKTPFAVAFDKTGNLYLVEYTGHRVRKIDGKGILTTIAGTGDKGFSGDGGPATKADVQQYAQTPP